MKKNFFYLLLFSFLFSCNSGDKKSADSKSSKKESANGEVTIKFKADGELVNTTGWIVQRFLWDEKTPAPWLNIVSNMHMDKRTINVNLNGTSPGKYVLQEGNMMKDSHGMYSPDFAVIMDSYSFVSGEFNLTEVDTVKNILNGTFYGVAKNANGKTITISDGQLMNVKMKSGVSNLTEEADKALKQ